MSGAPWFGRRFGPRLLKFDGASGTPLSLPVEKALRRAHHGVVGVYLVPLPDAGMRYANEDCGQRLKRLYDRLLLAAEQQPQPAADDENASCPRFEVVQVCFPRRPPTINYTLDQKAKGEYDSRLASVSWYALPFDSIERSVSTQL